MTHHSLGAIHTPHPRPNSFGHTLGCDSRSTATGPSTVQVLSELVEAAPLSPMQRWQIHDNLTKLHDLLGACERILRTPIPVAYTRHTTRCLILWLTVMPYALWGNLGWSTAVAAPLISFLLAGINEIGIDVEEPFSLLPLEAIADRARADCHEIVSMQVRSTALSGATHLSQHCRRIAAAGNSILHQCCWHSLTTCL